MIVNGTRGKRAEESHDCKGIVSLMDASNSRVDKCDIVSWVIRGFWAIFISLLGPPTHWGLWRGGVSESDRKPHGVPGYGRRDSATAVIAPARPRGWPLKPLERKTGLVHLRLQSGWHEAVSSQQSPNKHSFKGYERIN